MNSTTITADRPRYFYGYRITRLKTYHPWGMRWKCPDVPGLMLADSLEGIRGQIRAYAKTYGRGPYWGETAAAQRESGRQADRQRRGEAAIVVYLNSIAGDQFEITGEADSGAPCLRVKHRASGAETCARWHDMTDKAARRLAIEETLGTIGAQFESANQMHAWVDWGRLVSDSMGPAPSVEGVREAERAGYLAALRDAARVDPASAEKEVSLAGSQAVLSSRMGLLLRAASYRGSARAYYERAAQPAAA